METWLPKSDATIISFLIAYPIADMLHRRISAASHQEAHRREGWWWIWWIAATLVIRTLYWALYMLVDA